MPAQGGPPQQQAGFAPAQQAGFAPAPAAGFAPAPQQAGFAPPAPPPHAAPQGSPYAPQGAGAVPQGAGAPGPSPYAPQGGPQAPYSPHAMQPPPGYPMQQPGPRRSSKGLLIGLGVAVVAAAGAIVAVVLATRGGSGGGAGSRDELVKRTLAAMGEGDVEKLVKLSDPIGLYARAFDCSERDKPKPDKAGGSSDNDQDKGSDRAKDSDDDAHDDPELEEKRLRRKHERAVEKTKGMKLELISIAADKDTDQSGDSGKKDDKAGDRDQSEGKAGDKAGDQSEGKAGDKAGDGGKRKKDGLVMKKGDKAMKGCVFKLDVQIQEVAAKVRVTEAEGKEPSEREVRLVAVEAGGSWYLMGPVKLAPSGVAITAELRKYRDQMCKCKDMPCAEQVEKDMAAWSSSMGDAAKAPPKDAAEGIAGITAEMVACNRKLREGAELAELIAKMDDFKSKMCVCADVACASRVQQEMSVWSASVTSKLQVTQMTADDQQRLADITKAYAACSMKVTGGDDDAPRPADDPLPPEDPSPRSGTGTSTSSGTSKTGLTSLPACAEYRRQIDRIRRCPKYPPSTATTVRQGFDQMERAWAAARRPSAAVRDSTNQACQQIVDMLKQTFDQMCK